MSRLCRNRAMIVGILLGEFLLGAAYAVDDPISSEYLVPLEGCPSKMAVRVPREFTHASTPEARELRGTILDRLHSNPKRTARYTELFLTDWVAGDPFPQITLASLGSILRFQGKVSVTDWRKIRNEFANASRAKREQLATDYAHRLGTSVGKIQIPALYEERESSVVVLGSATAPVGNRQVNYVTAAKVVHIRGCIAFVAVAVDTSEPRYLEQLNRYVALLKVE